MQIPRTISRCPHQESHFAWTCFPFFSAIYFSDAGTGTKASIASQRGFFLWSVEPLESGVKPGLELQRCRMVDYGGVCEMQMRSMLGSCSKRQFGGASYTLYSQSRHLTSIRTIAARNSCVMVIPVICSTYADTLPLIELQWIFGHA